MPKDNHIHLYRHAIPVVLIAVLLGAAAGYFAVDKKSDVVIYHKEFSSQESKTEPIVNEKYSVRINLPAVSTQNDTGVTAYLRARAVKGTGKIFFNLENVLFSADTQQSARIAALVASNYTKKSIEHIDLYYDLTADATVLEGPSAGAAFTIVTIALLENKQVRSDIMMTGTINHDGTIGPAGKILEKARAAKEKDAKIFLVPFGLSTEINYTESEFCYTWGSKEFCTPELHQRILNISEEVGIPVKEVRTVDEAAKYFLK